MDTLKCKCGIRPFEPPKGCYEYCTAKILRYAKPLELEKYLDLPAELSDKIFDITADDKLVKLSNFKPLLTNREFDLLNTKLKNINPEGWNWIETTMKKRMNFTIMKPRALSASNITGTNVENLQGDRIGEIYDLMIDLERGEVLYAVLSHGGFLGMGTDYFAVPMQALQFGEWYENLIKVDIDKEVLENAPGFNKDNWPEHPTTDFINSVYDYYGYNRPKIPDM